MEATRHVRTPPVAAERSEVLDAVRAAALFGVIAINMLTISGLQFLGPADLGRVQGPADRAVAAVLAVFVEGKALAAFSLLFGLSFSLLIAGAARRGERFGGFFARRLLVLGLLGLLNATAFYWGDILTTYAVIGAFLPLAARLRQGTVLGLGLALILVPPVLLALAGLAPPGAPGFTRIANLAGFRVPSFVSTLDHNWLLFTGAVGAAEGVRLWRYTMIGGLFLLGLYVGRSGLLGRIEAERGRLSRIALLLVGGGAVIEAVRVAELVPAPAATALLAAKPLMGIGYVALGALVFARLGTARALVSPLGRMALTGYLMAGLIGQAVFYGWGLGLIGRVGTAGVLLWAAAIAAALTLFAHLWLARYRYGPWEWLWRWLSRLERPPLRL